MKHYTVFNLTLLFLFVAIGSISAQRNPETDKANIKAAYDALNRRDWPAFSAKCDPGYTELTVAPTPTVGINAAIELYKQFQTAFPDFMVKINDITAAGNNRYLVHVTVSGNNTGPFMMLPPTGKAIRFDDIDIVELDNTGKCINHSVTKSGEPLRQIGYGSMLNPNTRLVINLYENFGKRDIKAVLALCSDDVVFDIHNRMFDAKARMFNGKPAVGQFFQELGSKIQITKFQPTRFVADGDDVFALIDAEYQYVPDGKTYTSTYTHHFIVKNGQVVYLRGLDDIPVMK